MLLALCYWLIFLSAAVVVAMNGSRSARRFLGALLLATLATLAVRFTLDESQAAFGYLIIDIGLLLLVLGLALRLDVFWPMWFAGFQLITVASEFGRIILPGPVATFYGDLAGFWAVPALLSMAIGTVKDRQEGLKERFGVHSMAGP